jgi:hypothetical protein
MFGKCVRLLQETSSIIKTLPIFGPNLFVVSFMNPGVMLLFSACAYMCAAVFENKNKHTKI